MTETSRRVSYDQVKAIVDFMGQHLELAAGSMRTLEARHASKKLWGELTKILHSHKGGARKTAVGWSKYWSDFKTKLKTKMRYLNKIKKNGTTSKREIKPLTKLEKRLITILGPEFQKAGTKSNADNHHSTNHKAPEVKVEVYQENASSDFLRSESEASDRISDAEENEESGGQEEFDDDFPASPSINMKNICPKWLIDVEKKRAKAELIRAKAEEQRMSIAAKNAEAALAQAEALKKLSEAAYLQADAIMRIAVFLENRGHREDMLSM